MADRIRGITVEIGGDTQGLDKALSGVNKEISGTQNQLKDVERLLKLDPKNTELLAQKQQLLSQKVQDSSKKLETLKEAERQLSADGNIDKNSEQFMALRREIIATEGDINKAKNEMADLGKETEDAGNKSSGFGEKLKSGLASAAKVAAASIAAVTAAAVGLGKKFIDGINETAEYGDNIDKMSQKMGLSVEGYQEWDFIMQHNGTTIEGLKASMKTLANAAETDSDAFKELGISQEEIANMSQEELFNKTIASLQGVEDTTQRTYLAGKLLGKGATELGSLLNMSAEETEAMRQELHELGGVMSEETVKDAAAFEDSLQNLQVSAKSMSRDIKSLFLTGTTSIMDGLSEAFKGGLADWDKAEKLVEDGVTDILEIVEYYLSDVDWYIDFFKKIFSIILENTPKIIDMAVVVLKEMASVILSNLPVLLSSILSVLMKIAGSILDNIGIVIQTGIDILLALGQGIVQALPQLIPQIVRAILTIVEVLTDGDNIMKILEAAVEIVIALADGLLNSIPILIEKIPQIIDGLVVKLTDSESLGKIINAGIQLLISLVKNAPAIIGGILSIVPNIIDSLCKGLEGGIKNLAKIGVNLVKGLWNGINDTTDWILKKIKSFGKAVEDGLKKFFGIASPSKKTAWDGKMLALGLGVGFMSEIKRVKKTINNSLDGFFGATDTSLTMNGVLTNPNIPEQIITTKLDNNSVIGFANAMQGQSTNVSINFTGSLSALGELLAPSITASQTRTGGSLAV